ncbi:MAG TPA: hypothetical protein VNT50_01685 [Microbacterium sp.]|uniref:hypothetical protein n=1 Tax=Microbacterium sp. TaxID=51671 RepID=UPI002C7D4863|nr:hypothetical protein [Microbacterium sp.]HWI30181.1 hypothetical protein [Microbacterium sp.]
MNRRLTALTITAVALFGLTACTGSAGAAPSSSSTPTSSASEGSGSPEGSASVADACAVIQEQVSGAMSEFEGVDASSDPQLVIDGMTAAAEAIGTAIGDIDNDEVRTAAEGLRDAFAGMGEVMKAVVIDGDVSKAAEMQERTAQFQESFTAFQELCVQG